MADITNRDIFAALETHIRKEEFTDIDLLSVIGSFVLTAPHIAHAMLQHSVDYLTEQQHTDTGYTDVVVAMYYRTFFSPEHAGTYGTDHMVHDRSALETFSKYIIDPTSVHSIPDVLQQNHPTH